MTKKTKEIKQTIKEIYKDMKKVNNDIQLLMFLRQEIKFTEERVREELELY